jgi:hypothetical protein
MNTPSDTSATWQADPSGRHTHRYFDGERWTENIADDGQAGIDGVGLDLMNAPAPTVPVPVTAPDRKVSMFGARKVVQELEQQLAVTQQQLAQTRQQLVETATEASETKTRLAALGGMDYAQVQEAITGQRIVLTAVDEQISEARARLADLSREIIATEDVQVLQEAGVYEYRHPLTDAAAYQRPLKELQDKIKTMARADGGAVTGASNWTVNGSVVEGRRMVRENSKLMLRAYNAEADNLVRSLKPYKLDSANARLDKVSQTISKLGKTMEVAISPKYHALRLHELSLTADYLAKKAEEKERERAARARLREEAKVQQEMERERQRLEKEREHYRNALEALLAKSDHEAAERMQAQLTDLDKAIEDVDYRAANIRAGYVYVISNIGAFGEDMVKVGLTRRLDPMDRVRELGDASVPFRYDVHAILFAKDAVSIEHQLHQRLDDRRINRVNLRREFFRISPAEVKKHLVESPATYSNSPTSRKPSSTANR